MLQYCRFFLQFRQSIKRIFGIHTKGKQSHIGKGYNNTVMSPAHRMSGMNDATTRFNSTETIVSTSTSKKINKDKKLVFTDEVSEIAAHDNRTFQRDLELCTIQENRTASDAERSVETTCEEDNDHKLGVFGTSCKFFRKRSPVVTIIDTEHLIFSKIAKRHRTDDNELPDDINAYGNQAYEEHVSDRFKKNILSTENEYQTDTSHKVIKRSYSLDLSTVTNENKKRKLSVETKFQTVIQPRGFFKDTIVSKLFDQDCNQFKSYLYDIEKNESTDDDI